MTKKHFEAIAGAIVYAMHCTTADGQEGIRIATKAMADEFEHLNSNFDRNRFLDAALGDAASR